MQNSYKKKEEQCKHVIINQVSLEHLADMLYNSFFVFLVLVLHYCCGNNVKYHENTDFFQNASFKQSKNMGAEKISGYSNGLLLKTVSFSYQMEQKHLSKQIAPITYTLEKTFFTTATCEGLCVVNFQIE